MVNTALG